MRKMLLSLAVLLSVAAMAQDGRQFRRYNCLAPQSETEADDAALARGRRGLPAIRSQWDSTRIYRQAVVLVAFADFDFSMDDPRERYDLIFNQPGYNEGKGAGCVADYFRSQSGGLFNAQFDIFGPVKLAGKAKGYSNYGATAFREAMQALVDSVDTDFTPYDWDGDGQVEQVIFIYAGYGGNEAADICDGHIWPNTASFTKVYANDRKLSISNYTASAELWSNDRLCGIGTVCHEFTHSLGLPDIYPTTSSAGYSIVDEWDLMDGGNFTNNGWCPPNYTGMEKMLLGWATPVVIDEPDSFSGMLPISEGGPIYQVKKSNTEYYLLENRQWSGWDLRLPGHGLVVFHVDYTNSAWSGNTVNNTKTHRRFQLIAADNRTYDDWDAIVGNTNPYVSGHSRILSGAPYPYVNADEGIDNHELTDTSEPAATVFSGLGGLMSKPITNIRESADGLISFDFMGGYLSTIERSTTADLRRDADGPAFDLGGRPAQHARLQIMNGKKRFLKHQ